MKQTRRHGDGATRGCLAEPAWFAGHRMNRRFHTLASPVSVTSYSSFMLSWPSAFIRCYLAMLKYPPEPSDMET